MHLIKACTDLAPRYPDVWEWSFARVRFVAMRHAEVRRSEVLAQAYGTRVAGDQSPKAEGWKSYVTEMGA